MSKLITLEGRCISEVPSLKQGKYAGSKPIKSKKNRLLRTSIALSFFLGSCLLLQQRDLIQKKVVQRPAQKRVKLGVKKTKSAELQALKSQTVSQDTSKSALRALMTDAVSKMPRKKDLQRMSAEEVHHTPQVIADAGYRLGVIAEFLSLHPEHTKAVISFYKTCAYDSEFPTSIRAVCYSHILKNSSSQGGELSTEGLPSEVLEIAKLLITK